VAGTVAAAAAKPERTAHAGTIANVAVVAAKVAVLVGIAASAVHLDRKWPAALVEMPANALPRRQLLAPAGRDVSVPLLASG